MRTIAGLIGSVCTVLLLSGQPLTAQTQVETLREQAVQALVAQDFATARKLAVQLEQMIDQGPRPEGTTGVSQYGLVAEMLFHMGDAEGAERAYSKAVEAARSEGLWTSQQGLYVRYEYGSLLLVLGRTPAALAVGQDLLGDLESLGQLAGPAGLDTAILVGMAQQTMGDPGRASRTFKAAVDAAQESGGDGQKLRLALVGLTNALTELGAFEAALDPARRVVEIDQRQGASGTEQGLFARLRFGMALEGAGELAEGRSVTQAVLDDALRTLPNGHDVTQFARRTLEKIERAEGRKFAARALNRQITGAAITSEDPSVRLDALLNLASHNLADGELDGYEQSLLAALDLITEHPQAAPPTRRAEILFSLADFLVNHRLMFAEAKSLYDLSISIMTQELGPHHRETLRVKARRIQAKDKEIQVGALPNAAGQAVFWDGTGEGRKPTADDLETLRRLADEESKHGTRFEAYAAHLKYAFYLSEAGQFDRALGVIDTQIAKRRAERSVANPEIDYRLADAQGTALLKSGRYASAARAFGDGTDALLLYLRGLQWLEGQVSATALNLQGQVYGELYASAVLRAAEGSPSAEKEQLTEMAFEAMQLAGYGPASVAVARASIREAAEDPELVKMAADWQRAVLNTPEEGQNTDLDRLRSRMSADFAQYFEWQIPAPADLTDVQKTLLDPDEALITLLTATTQSASDDAVKGLVLAVTQDQAVLAEVPLDWAQVVQDISALHQSLDPKVPERMAALRAPLASVQETPDAAPRLAAPFAFDAAQRLHDAFFGEPEIAALINSKPVWTLVPYGETMGIPFAALIAGGDRDISSLQRRTADELRQIRWLGHERALQVVPSVHALKALRAGRTQQPQASRLAYVGIGAPEFSGAQYAALPSTDAVMLRSASERLRAVSALPALPGTRREIEALAGVFGIDRSEVRLGAEANEVQIKALNDAGVLAQADILHFATHGLLSGAFEGLSEPALALTPDLAASDDLMRDRDGLLTASEAARLNLNADWVILSACDTAGEDTLGGEGLGGLVQGFFAAGARNVLASHWRVDDQAAERLITRTVGLSQNGTGKAEALRRAMLELSEDQTRDQSLLTNAHPSVWAPFLMIGGG